MPDFKFLKKDRKEKPDSSAFKTERKETLEPASRPVLEKRETVEREPPALEESKIEKETPSRVTPLPTPAVQPVQIEPLPKSETLIKIENILAEGLKDIYVSLDEPTKKQFKAEGERVARGIEGLIQQVKVKIKEILSLIRNWLIMIPGINKYFIEQETKIKLDKIMMLQKR